MKPETARLALATSSDLRDGHPDDQVLIERFRRQGVHAVWTVWNDPRVDWASYDLVVIRTPWDYTEQYGRFLEWVEAVEIFTPVFHPSHVIRWNSDKRYLLELAGAGIPIGPTRLLEAGYTNGLKAACLQLGLQTAFLKPTVGASSRDTLRFTVMDDREMVDAEGFLGTCLDGGKEMLL
ncbi:hypothetical protein GF324_06485, partial [bacterium]|nr:hypothetical protein [bacterium]